MSSLAAAHEIQDEKKREQIRSRSSGIPMSSLAAVSPSKSGVLDEKRRRMVLNCNKHNHRPPTFGLRLSRERISVRATYFDRGG